MLRRSRCIQIFFKKYNPERTRDSYSPEDENQWKMNISLSPFEPENLVPRDEFGSQSRPASAILDESGAYLLHGIPPDFRGGDHLFV